MLVWTKVGECLDEGFITREVWNQRAYHSSGEGQNDPEKEQVAWTNEKLMSQPQRGYQGP